MILSGRSTCVSPLCKCTSFIKCENTVGGIFSPRYVPKSPSEVCDNCQHPWFAHTLVPLPSTNTLYSLQRGSYSNLCGGFFSESQNISLASICSCGNRWADHEPLLDTLRASLAMTSAIVTSAAPSVGSQAYAFTDRSEASAANFMHAGARGGEIIGGITGGPTAAQAVAMSSAITTSAARPVTSFSGLPHAAMGNSASRRTQSMVHYRAQVPTGGASRRAFPQTAAGMSLGSSPTSSKLISVLFFPHGAANPRMQDGYHPSPLTIHNHDILEITRRFEQYGLFFTISVARQGSLWRDITSQIRTHFATHQIHMIDNSGGVDEFHLVPWLCLGSTRRNSTNDKFTLKENSLMTSNTCTLSELEKIAKKIPNPREDLADQPLILMTTRYGPLKSPLNPNFSALASAHMPHVAHACWSDFVCRGLLPHSPDVFGFCDNMECYTLSSFCPLPPTNSPLLYTRSTPQPTLSHSTASLPLETPRTLQTNANVLNQLGKRTPRLRPSSDDIDDYRPPIRTRYHSQVPSTSQIQLALPMPSAASAAVYSSAGTVVGDSVAEASTLLCQAPPLHQGAPDLMRVTPSLRRPSYSSLLPSLDIALDGELLVWRGGAMALVPYDLTDSNQVIHIHARTITAMASCLLELVVHLFRLKDSSSGFPPPFSPSDKVPSNDIIHCSSNITLFSFFDVIRRYKVGVRPDGSAVSFGAGIERGTFRCLMDIITQQGQYWEQRGSYFVPAFSRASGPITGRIHHFKACGFLAAQHTLLYTNGPIPISPFLIIAIILGKDSLFSLRRSFIEAVDPEASERLAPWWELAASDPLPKDAMSPLGQFLIYVMDMQLCELDDQRTEEEHDSWTKTFLSKVLLGNSDPWNHPEFVAFRDGFDMALTEGTKPKRFIQTFIDSIASVPALIAGLYNREVTSLSQVLDHLKFEITRANPDGTTNHWANLFQLALGCYLRETGHPIQAADRGLITPEVLNSGQRDSLLRPRLLLYSCTDSNLLPAQSDWKIMFVFDGTDGEGDEVHAGNPLHIHTCDRRVDVMVDRHLETLLEGVDANGHSEAFDVWIHMQLLDAMGKYSTV